MNYGNMHNDQLFIMKIFLYVQAILRLLVKIFLDIEPISPSKQFFNHYKVQKHKEKRHRRKKRK